MRRSFGSRIRKARGALGRHDPGAKLADERQRVALGVEQERGDIGLRSLATRGHAHGLQDHRDVDVDSDAANLG